MKIILIVFVCLAACLAEATAKPPCKSSVKTDANYAKAVQVSTARAIAMFPDYDTEGTSLHQAVQEELEWQKKHNPATFDQPDWPERIAKACAALLGIEPARPMQASASSTADGSQNVSR